MSNGEDANREFDPMLANKINANEAAAKDILEAADVFEALSDALADAILRLGEEKAAAMRRNAYQLEAPAH